LGDVARARRMSQNARESELTRESPYDALFGDADRSQSIDAILKAASALGLKWSTSVKAAAIIEDVVKVA
jgi:DNA-binding phage protein